jgi:hypothetical protein
VLQTHPAIITAAQAALQKYGAGLSSVRFICGTQDIHKVSVHNLSSPCLSPRSDSSITFKFNLSCDQHLKYKVQNPRLCTQNLTTIPNPKPIKSNSQPHITADIIIPSKIYSTALVTNSITVPSRTSLINSISSCLCKYSILHVPDSAVQSTVVTLYAT